MKATSKVFATIALVTLFFACSQSTNEKMMADSEVVMDSSANKFISSSAAVENGKDSTRKFIRTAELKFKVKSVVNATYAIEHIIN